MDILRDYEEYFVDGIIEGKNEMEIISSLGSPKEIANELLAESNIKNENKIKGKAESFFIEAKGKIKSGLNKFKVNLNDKEHVKSRKKIEFLQILITIILLPFAFAIVCSTIGVGAGLIGSLIALVVGTSLEKYFKSSDNEYTLNQSSFKGLINEDLMNNPIEYFVNIRSANVQFN